MATVHTNPRRITVDYIRPGDEIAAWRGGDLMGMWRDHWEDAAEWFMVKEVTPANAARPHGTQIIKVWGGPQRKVDWDQFIVIREPVQVPDELICDCG